MHFDDINHVIESVQQSIIRSVSSLMFRKDAENFLNQIENEKNVLRLNWQNPMDRDTQKIKEKMHNDSLTTM